MRPTAYILTLVNACIWAYILITLSREHLTMPASPLAPPIPSSRPMAPFFTASNADGNAWLVSAINRKP